MLQKLQNASIVQNQLHLMRQVRQFSSGIPKQGAMCRDMTALKSAHQMPLSEPHPYQTNYNSIPPQTFLQKMSAAVF